MAKPNAYPEWAASGLRVEPNAAKKAAGWADGEKPPARIENWKDFTVYEWIKYLNEQAVTFSSFEEIWCGDGSTVSATANPLTGFSRWGCTIATGGTFSAVAAPNASYAGNWCELSVTTSAGSRTRMNTMSPLFFTSDECEFWMEFDLTMSATAGVQANIGFCAGLPYDSGKYASFTKAPSGTIWEMDRYSGTHGTSTSAGAASVATGTEPNQTLRLEWCGANTPNGAGSNRLRYLSGDTVLLSTTVDIPDGAAMYLFVDVQGNTPAASRRLRLGRVRAGWNRFSWS